DVQPQPGAVLFSVAEERLEDAVPNRDRNSAAIVLNAHLYLIGVAIDGYANNATCSGHGSAGVQYQVMKHALELLEIEGSFSLAMAMNVDQYRLILPVQTNGVYSVIDAVNQVAMFQPQ